MVGAIALLANLSASLTDHLEIKNEYLLFTLGAVVLVALLLYMRFTFFLIVVLLVIGANLPGQYAQALGISKIPQMSEGRVVTRASFLYAAAKGHAGLVELFLSNRVDSTLVSNEGDSAVDLAPQLRHA